MLNKKIAYEDFNGNEREEIFQFNLTEKELMNFVAKYGVDSLTGAMARISDTGDSVALMALVEDLVESAYGQKSDDGRFFHKTPEMLAEFKACPAYSVLFMEFASDENAISNFMTGCVNEKARQRMRENEDEAKKKLAAASLTVAP